MARLTETESHKAKVKRHVKQIWKDRLGKEKSEITDVDYKGLSWKVSTNKKHILIPRGKIDDLFSESDTTEMKKKTISDIENILKHLIE